MQIKLIGVFFFLGIISGCGVRGDPVPPGTPAELGHGQPSYRRATEEFAMPDLPPVYDHREDKDAEENEDE